MYTFEFDFGQLPDRDIDARRNKSRQNADK